jgi:tetratricopeptide (TPR) repeat protein
MKSTASSLTLLLLGFVSTSGCHQTAQQAASMTRSILVPAAQAEDYETQLGVARTQEREGKTKAAQKAYERLVKENPTNPVVYHRLGVIAAGDGDFDTANGNFRRAFELTPDNAELLADWGYSLFLQGQFVEAEELTRQGADLAPYDNRIANNLRQIYENSSLTPPVGPQMVQLMPSDQQGIVVAETLDDAVSGSELEWQRARYKESLYPVADATLPVSDSAVEFLMLSSTEPGSAELLPETKPIATEPAAFGETETLTLPEPVSSELAAIKRPAALPTLNEPVAIEPADANATPANSGACSKIINPCEAGTRRWRRADVACVCRSRRRNHHSAAGLSATTGKSARRNRVRDRT